MFDMSKIGRNISSRRKALGMTQMELADKLGISFQAVSNWERGQTCPDISKLDELAEILDCSIDELLGSARAAEVIKQVEEENPNPDITADELVEVAPILKPEQVDRTFGSLIDKLGGLKETISKKIDAAFDGGALGKEIKHKVQDALGKASSALDGVSSEDVHVERLDTGGKGFGATITITTKKEREELERRLRARGFDEDEVQRLLSLAKRVGTDEVSAWLDEYEKDSAADPSVEDELEALRAELDSILYLRPDERARLEKLAERYGAKAVRDKLDEYSGEVAEHLEDIEEELEDEDEDDEDEEDEPDERAGDERRDSTDVETLARLAPFLSTEAVNGLLRKVASSSKSPAVLGTLAAFADEDALGDAAREIFSRTGSVHDLAALAPFLDEDDLGEIAKAAVARDGSLHDLASLAPFMDEDDLGAIARQAVERGGNLSDLASLAPFMDESDLGEIAKSVVARCGNLHDLASIAPFLDESDIGEIAKQALERGGNLSDLASLAPFMDADDLGKIAKQVLARGGNLSDLASIAPFLDGDDLGDLVREAIERDGDTSGLAALLPFLGGKRPERPERI